MTAATLSYTIDDVIARLRELAQNGHAPGVRAWNRQRGPDLPIYETLSAHGHDWHHLCELAGLEPAKRGGPPGSRGRTVPFDEADAEVRHRLATASPPPNRPGRRAGHCSASRHDRKSRSGNSRTAPPPA